jgi:hypothetical protein
MKEEKKQNSCIILATYLNECTFRKSIGRGVANLINSVSKDDEEKSIYNPKEIMFSYSFSEKIIYQVVKIR